MVHAERYYVTTTSVVTGVTHATASCVSAALQALQAYLSSLHSPSLSRNDASLLDDGSVTPPSALAPAPASPDEEELIPAILDRRVPADRPTKARDEAS